jgi:hypothetical protein
MKTDLMDTCIVLDGGVEPRATEVSRSRDDEVYKDQSHDEMC